MGKDFKKGNIPWNKGKLKLTSPDEIRTCTECKQEKNITQFVKGKGHLYRYLCKECRQNGRRTGKISNTRFQKGHDKGVRFEKGHIPWFKIRGVPIPATKFPDSIERDSIKHRKWKKKVKDRDNNMCIKCKKLTDLQTHHIKSWKDNIDLRFDVNNGVTLCIECHKKEHKKIR